MGRTAHRLVSVVLLTAACSAPGRASRPVAAPVPAPAPASSDAAVAIDAADDAPDAAPPAHAHEGPSASDSVRARLDDAPVLTADVAAWVRFELLEQVRRATGGELLAPTAPIAQGDRVVWSLVAPEAAGHDEAFYRDACARASGAVPGVACAVDTVEVGALSRPRIAFGWRREEGDVRVDLALPLRALARIHDGACLLAAERTLRTLELRVQVPDLRALGTTLAQLAMAPHLAELVLIDTEAAGGAGSPAGAINARLSWSTDRADRDRAELGTDPWPARCGDRVSVGAGSPPHSPLTALFPVTGTRARGAVVNVARHEWLVTDGDQVGDATIASVADRGVFVRRAGAPANARPTLARFRAPAASNRAGAAATVRPQPPPLVAPRLGPVRIPPPPEPPATP